MPSAVITIPGDTKRFGKQLSLMTCKYHNMQYW